MQVGINRTSALHAGFDLNHIMVHTLTEGLEGAGIKTKRPAPLMAGLFIARTILQILSISLAVEQGETLACFLKLPGYPVFPGSLAIRYSF